MSTLAEMVVRLGVDASRLQRGLKVAAREVQGFSASVVAGGLRAGRGFETMGARITGVGRSARHLGAQWSLALLPLGYLIHVGMEKLSEMQVANAQTAATIKAIGDAAGVSVEQVQAMAEQLHDLSGIDTQELQTAANTLLTMGNIRGLPNLKLATLTVADFASKAGVAAPAAAKTLAKALADPENSMSRLARQAGITKAEQQHLVDQMGKMKDPAARQALLLHALEDRFGGAAEAAGKTMPAKLAKAREAFKLAAANLTTILLPAVSQLATDVTKAANGFSKLSPELKKVIAYGGAVAIVLGPITYIVGAVSGALGFLVKVVGKVIGVLAAIGGAAIEVFQIFAGGAGELSAFGSAVETIALVAWSAFEVVVAAVGAIIAAIASVGAGLVAVIVAIVAAVGVAVYEIVTHWNEIVSGAEAAFNAVGGIVSTAVNGIIAAVVSLGNGVGAAWDFLTSLTVSKVAYAFGYALGFIVGTLIRLTIQAGQLIGRFAVILWNGAQRAVTGFIGFMMALPGRAWSLLTSVVSGALRFGGMVASAVGNGALRAVSAFVNFAAALPGRATVIFAAVVVAAMRALAALPGQIVKFVSGLAKDIVAGGKAIIKAAIQLGEDICSGIVQGIKSGAGSIASALSSAASGALKGAKHALGIKSPSTVAAAEIGLPFSQGIAVGIWQGAEGVASAAEAVAQRAADAASRTVGKADDIRAAKLMKHAQKLRAIADGFATGVIRLQTSDNLAAQFYDLNVALNGGNATLAMQIDRVAQLKTEYEKLTAFMSKNAKQLTSDQRLSILQELTSLVQQMNDIKSSMNDAATPPTIGGSTPTSTTTTTTPTQTVTAGQSRTQQRPVIQQNFIGPNVDHFAAARNAMFAHETAGMVQA